MMFLYYVLIHETWDLKEDALPLSHDCICEPLVVMCSVASITASFKPRLSQFSTLYLLLIKHWYPESPPPDLGSFKHIQETPLCSSTNQALTDLTSLLHWHVSVEQVLTCFFWVLFWKDFWEKKGRGSKNHNSSRQSSLSSRLLHISLNHRKGWAGFPSVRHPRSRTSQHTHRHTELSWSHPRYLLPAVAGWLMLPHCMSVCAQRLHPSFSLRPFLKSPPFLGILMQ